MKDHNIMYDASYAKFPTAPAHDTIAADCYVPPMALTPNSKNAVAVVIIGEDANDASIDPDYEVKERNLATKILYLIVFHTLNAALGIGGFCIVVTGVSVSVGLIPLCCIGLVLFQITTLVTKYMAKCDIAITNLLTADKRKHLRIHPNIQSGFSVENGKPDTVCSRLMYFSPKLVAVMLYFLTLKFAMGILSCVAVGWGVGLPIVIVATGGTEDLVGTDVEYDDHPVAYVFIALGCWLVGLVCIPLVACLTQKLTKECCADNDKKRNVTSPVAVLNTPVIDPSDK